MRSNAHLTKAARFEGALTALDPPQDGIAIAWALMHASVQLANAVLHETATTQALDAYPTMAAGVYVWHGADGRPNHGPRPFGDIIHAFLFDAPADVAHGARRALDLLGSVDRIAMTAARGADPLEPEQLQELRDCHSRLRTLASEVCGERVA